MTRDLGDLVAPRRDAAGTVLAGLVQGVNM
jgi:hypothetical protein